MTEYRFVNYNGKQYYVGKYTRKNKDENRLFVIDASDHYKIADKTWYNLQGDYVGRIIKKNNISQKQYLQNVILSHIISRYYSNKYRITHINGCRHDNRKSNLRITSQPIIKNKKLNKNIPKKSGITSQEIPKYIHYVKPQSNHGEMFVIEIIINGKKCIWKSSSSKNISIHDKYAEIKEKLKAIEKIYPEIKKNYSPIYNQHTINSLKEFNHIIKLSGFRDGIKNNTINIESYDNYTREKQDSNMMDTEQAIRIINKTGRRHVSNLPENCKIKPEMIPKYCYYRPTTEKAGDAFIIDNHPKLPNGTRVWSTTSNRNISIYEKFNDLRKKIKEMG